MHASAQQWFSLAILILCTLTVLGNLLVFRGLRAALPAAEAPFVSILVPARDEARNIESCVGSLLVQDYPAWELIVLDDHSSDGTGEIVQGLLARESHGKPTRLLTGKSLPDGWTGKNWACHQLSEAASGEYLVFIDADTTHAPGALTAIVDFAERRRADLISPWPRFITCTLGEKLIVPVIVLIGFTFCLHWLVVLLQRYPSLARRLGSRITGALGTANGQIMCFRRSAYQRIGGHAAVRRQIAEDVALGRAVAAQMGQGMRLYNCDALRFSRVRMYRSFGESWAGFVKNLRALFGRHVILFWLFVLCLWSCFLAPCVAWLWRPASARPCLGAELIAVVAIRILITLRFRLSWLGALLRPVGIALFIGIALQSWWLFRTRGVVWKDRTYC